MDDRKLIIDVEMDHKGDWSLMPLDLADEYPFDLFCVAVDSKSNTSSSKILFWRCRFIELGEVIDLFLPACLEYLDSLEPSDFSGRSGPAVSPDVYPKVGGLRLDTPNPTS
ncbi:hypothetical protein [Sulfuriroseicoccus oceanibius]|uniref:Uncharacterized protein n=1 Tax=Sulfuriroseicoccus oceanibius TaxID=2707525 RepID=A0A6B3L933_9BACT|nr:hypothetical protein [Sulfuriroseicoccus oceanibius]QQL44421.1 hypothetical protein G3M56_011065 [Sulfuriroseicoccus oceanibius]